MSAAGYDARLLTVSSRMVEPVQHNGSPGVPVHDRGDRGRDPLGPFPCDPVAQKHLVLHLAAQAVGQMVAQQVVRDVATVIREMGGEELDFLL